METYSNGTTSKEIQDRIHFTKTDCCNFSRDTNIPKTSYNVQNSVSSDAIEDLTEYDELNPRTMEFDRLVELMHPKFLTEYLNRIYSFLKSGNKEMCFPNIAPYKEIFLVRLASNANNLRSSVFNKECKDISENIMKLLAANKDVYEWKYFYEDGRITKNVLIYKKVYKNTANYHQVVDKSKPTMDPEPDWSDTTSNISDNGPKLSKKQRRQLILQKCVNSLQQPFIHNTIQALQDFIRDELRASLEFPNLTAYELKFLRHVSNMTSRRFYRFVTNDVKCNLKNFNESLNNCHKKFRLRMEQGTVERSIIIKKVPRFESVSSQGQNNALLDKQSVISFDSDCNTSIDSRVSRDKSISRERSFSKNHRNKAIGIRFQSAGYEKKNTDSQAREQTSDHEERTQSKERVIGLNERKSKLMQAMSTPLESDRGLRMMKLMGWDGGALGARGEGIVEPIMPALEIVTGRGLGHTSNTQQSKIHTPEEFRVGILEKILELFHSPENVKEIEYHRKLNRKERNFVSTSVKSLNNRRNIGLNNEREIELVNTLKEKMLNAPDLRLESDIAVSRKKVTITKSTHTTPDLRQKLKTSKIERTMAKLQIEIGNTSPENSNKNTEIKNGRKCRSVTIEEIEKKSSIPYKVITTKDINSLKTDYKVNSMLTTCKSVKTIAYKIVCMTAILDFVKSEELAREIRFDSLLNTKQCRYVHHIVEHVNTRLHKGVGSKIEIDMVKQMIDGSRGCFLSVEFNKTFNHFILRKSYYKKRFVNSAQNPHVSPSNDNTTPVNNTNNSIANNVKSSVAAEDNKNEISSNIDCKVTDKTDCNNSLSKELDLSVNITNVTDTSKISTETDMEELDNDIKRLESLIMNADCDIFDDNNESIINTENSLQKEENTSNLSPNTKRSRTTSEDSDVQTAKKIKFDLEKYCIVPNNYPEEKINIATVIEIQMKISDSINVTSEFLPLLSCHGIQDGGLIYSCHSEKTLKWLEDIVTDANLKMIKFNNTYEPKIIMKINSYVKIDVKTLFEKIELYNEEVITGNWRILEEYVYNDFIVYILQVDRDSLKFIKGKKFSLFIGVDKATFSIVTD